MDTHTDDIKLAGKIEVLRDPRSVLLFTMFPTQTPVGLKTGFRGEKPTVVA
jgi:hypothetical protein